MKPIPRSAFVLLAVLALFWGANWPVLKIAVREAPVFWFRLVCVWGSAVGLFAIAAAAGQSLAVPRGQRLRLAWVSMFSILGWNAFSGFGVLHLPAGRASMLGYTMPLWLALFSVFMLKERMARANAAALALGMSGVALLIGEDAAAFTRAPVGALCMLGAAASWACAVAMIKRRPFALTATVQMAWMMTAGGLPLALLAWRYGGLDVPVLSLAAWLAIAYNVFIAGVLCYWAFYKLVNMLPAAVTGMSSLSVPVIGVLTGIVFLGEVPTSRDWLALALIVTALAIVLLWQPHRGATPDSKKRGEIARPSD
jgi:drug/metabolite transporter (DMT)-like permease